MNSKLPLKIARLISTKGLLNLWQSMMPWKFHLTIEVCATSKQPRRKNYPKTKVAREVLHIISNPHEVVQSCLHHPQKALVQTLESIVDASSRSALKYSRESRTSVDKTSRIRFQSSSSKVADHPLEHSQKEFFRKLRYQSLQLQKYLQKEIVLFSIFANIGNQLHRS